MVQPNELSREEPYIERNIAATRAAFGLDDKKSRRRTFDYDDDARTEPTSQSNEADARQRAALRPDRGSRRRSRSSRSASPSTEFNDVDVDRYKVGATRSRADARAVRELDPRTSRQTRGRASTSCTRTGTARSRGREPQRPGPADLPRSRASRRPAICRSSTRQPGVYFGEDMSAATSVVDTKVAEQEADRRAATRKSTQYTARPACRCRASCARARSRCGSATGTSSCRARSRASRASSTCATSSERVQTVAPFLRFDSDPYPVVVDGRILWVLDAYTTTNRYPYSQSIHPQQPARRQRPRHRLQLRAQLGEGDGRRVRRHGELLRRRPERPDHRDLPQGVPRAVHDAQPTMPAGLQEPLAVPRRHLQRADRAVHAVPHHRSGAVLQQAGHLGHRAEPDSVRTTAATTRDDRPGNNGGRNTTLRAVEQPDRSAVPDDAAARRSARVRSSCSSDRSCPDERRPCSRRSWSRAYDGENYGKLVVVRVPTTSAPSPAQAATLIESDQFISSQFSLLDQRGSKVMRGDVQLIPIGNAILYVRPIWITGEGEAAVPALPFVAAVVGDQAVLGCDMSTRSPRHRRSRTAARARHRRPLVTRRGPDEPRQRDGHRTADDHDARRPRPTTHRAASERDASSQLLAAGARPSSTPAEAALDGRRPRRRTSSTSAEAQRLVGRGVEKPGHDHDDHDRRPRPADHAPGPPYVGPGARDCSGRPGDCYYGRSVNSRRGRLPPGRPGSPEARGGVADGRSGHRSGQVQARLARHRELRLQAQEGPERGGRPRDLVPQVRARVDDEVPAERAEALRAQADARVVRQEHARRSTSTTSTTTSSRPTGRSTTGTCSRKR